VTDALADAAGDGASHELPDVHGYPIENVLVSCHTDVALFGFCGSQLNRCRRKIVESAPFFGVSIVSFDAVSLFGRNRNRKKRRRRSSMLANEGIRLFAVRMPKRNPF
jgi:hypothetical protein